MNMAKAGTKGMSAGNLLREERAGVGGFLVEAVFEPVSAVTNFATTKRIEVNVRRTRPNAFQFGDLSVRLP